MNFKQFGLGKQLINPSVATYGKYIDANGVEQTSASGLVNHTDYISVTANRLYTVSYSKPPVSGNVIAVSWYDSNKIFIKRDSETMPFELGRYKFTKTAPNNAAFAIVNFTYFSAYTETQNTHNYIFAIGESQLPYEPYGNTWTDIPYYIMRTSTDIITTPADIYANDITATVGLKGQMVQSSTPTPTTPIQPSECGERTANLFDRSTSTIGKIISTDETITDNENYSVSDYIPVTSGNYTFSLINNYTGTGSTNNRVLWFNSTKENRELIFNNSGTRPKNVIGTFTIVNSGYIRFSYRNTDTNIILNTGSTALPYEPYGVKIPILSNSTTTNVYLGEVQTTRKIKKLVLDGTENWLVESETNGLFTLPNVIPLIQYNNQLCTHFSLASSYANFYNTDLTFAVVTRPCILIHYNACQTVRAFKAFLASEYAAGHPVTIWYVLPTPQTAVVNEPLRKIGDYADEVSGITIPTIAGANTISVGTTLQPSEVTVNYKGWHPVADVHEYDSNYNTIATMQALTIAQLQTHTISDLQGGEWS